MSISFNDLPNSTRTPNVYAEIDNSRALKGLAANPHKVLIVGQPSALSPGTVEYQTLIAITRDSLADGYFGVGSELARMCNVFKKANPNTELFAMPISTAATIAASGTMDFSAPMSDDAISNAGTLYLLCNGTKITCAVTSGMSGMTVASLVQATLNASTYSHVGLAASAAVSTGTVNFACTNSGAQGNFMDVRFNYYEGESFPNGYSRSMANIVLSGGVDATGPDLEDVWSVIEGEQFNYIIQPYTDATNLASIENELADRFKPQEDLQGQGFTVYSATQGTCTTLGNTRNSGHNTIMGMYSSPTAPEEIAASLGAIAAKNLNNDPARPLHFLRMPGVLPPAVADRFTRAERETLLFDGIATSITDVGGHQLIERCITTYQANALGLPDYSYLDIQTMATLAELRYQFKVKMANSYIVPRFKLADDTFPITAGSKVATPSLIKATIVSLFYKLRDQGLIENIGDFVDNLVVERNSADVNRIDCLLSPDLTNQFRVIAGLIQFIL